MSVMIQQFPREPIIIARFYEPFDPAKDIAVVVKRLQAELDDTKDSLYYVADMSAVTVKFSELVRGLAQLFADKTGPYTNPRLRIFMVSGDQLIAFGIKAAAEQAQYGSVDVSLYASMDSAMTKVRKSIAAESASGVRH